LRENHAFSARLSFDLSRHYAEMVLGTGFAKTKPGKRVRVVVAYPSAGSAWAGPAFFISFSRLLRDLG
jgi:hypothetical protein